MKRSTLAAFGMFLALAGGVFAQDKGKNGAGSAAKGKDVFESNCSVCHNADSTEQKVGPGLKGLYKRETLTNKKKVTDANVLEMINMGGNGMPAFSDMLTPAEKADVIAYLKTL